MTQSNEVSIVQFGPYRVIGMRAVHTDEQTNFGKLWDQEFLPRVGEIKQASSDQLAFGICRCIPGTFEYIAGMAADADAPLPEGMVEVQIPASTYVVFPVNGLEEIGQAWQQIQPWMEAHPEYVGYCGPVECDCAHYPSFELYPPTFPQDHKLSIYVPVRAKA